MDLRIKYKTLFEKNGLTTKLRTAHFMAQIEHESSLKAISENLNYSKEGLLKTFGKYFKNDLSIPYNKSQLETYNKDSRKKASEYARNPEKIANRVYANRMGNGDENSGAGWKYRGRGFLQITGKDNYTQLSNDTGIDFLNNPDLLLEEPNALISALWFWKKNNINSLSDKNDIKAITKRINGGYTGLIHRVELFKKYYAS